MESSNGADIAPADTQADVDARTRMVAMQLRGRDIRDARVLDAMQRVPRHALLPASERGRAYDDCALPLGRGHTVSQPYVVALMTQLAHVGPGARVLDVGSGCGYQAAVLSAMGCDVVGVELDAELVEQTRARLRTLGFSVEVSVGDGYFGAPERAPFDAIVVAAAAPRVPGPLVEQLAVGGRLIIPLGDDDGQLLTVVRRTDAGVETHDGIPVRFVPMEGRVRRAAD